MNVWLLYQNSEFGTNNGSMYKNEIIQDLNLDIIFKAMAREDKYILKTVRSAMLNCLTDKKTILYRQAIVMDCINNFELFNEIYQKSANAIKETEQYLESTKKSSNNNISNAVNVLNSLHLLGILVGHIENLKEFLNSVEGNFKSPGMISFYDRFISDYNYEFGLKIKNSIEDMSFLTVGGQISFSASIGQGLKISDIIINDLTKEGYKKKSKTLELIKRIYYKFFKSNIIVLDDLEVAHDAREMEAAGLVHILKMYQNFIKELMSFFESLHYQMAFYVGAVNLYMRFQQLHIPTSMPHIAIDGSEEFKFKGLYDLSMAIYSRSCPVCNELEIEHKSLLIITGANQGGKSTYLRSIGIAQLLMQCGLFVPATYYSNSLCNGIYTHFTRREDSAMNSGKLDEELSRMNRIISSIKPGAMLLMNESFATTTEREGSMIAYDVVNALSEIDVRIITVTHLFEFTKSMYEKKLEKALFLSAERLEDGTRTFKILIKEPERTSYGVDLYEQIVGA